MFYILPLYKNICVFFIAHTNFIILDIEVFAWNYFGLNAYGF